MGKNIRKQDALDYHSRVRPGKIEVISSKSTKTQRDLALAYSPGVAEPCKEIAEDPDKVFKYTAKSNLVAVITNGTAVLGLGDIGPEASKPVMEGKGVLFKIYADIDVFDLELKVEDTESFIQTVKNLEPTFGGINLEDIKSPECFEIERRLKKEMNIPVMHDDQHGTAIIASAALLNALELAGKKIEEVRVVFSGAGASAMSCVRLFCSLGVKAENVVMTDSKGVIHKGRSDLDDYKRPFAIDNTDMETLADAFKGADVFVGLSAGGIVTKEMISTMAEDPIVFALANPDPEISYPKAMSVRKDIIMATGRSDYPNQVNNVLGFPFIFRGALDVYATEINEAMKIASVHALADLARQPVPEIVNMAYEEKNIVFGREYIIPKPMDPRLLETVAPAVAKAAMDSGSARHKIEDWDEYRTALNKRLGRDDQLIRLLMNRARSNPKRVVFAEADNFKILKAVQIARDEGILEPILLGSKKRIREIIKTHQLELEDVPIINPRGADLREKRQELGKLFFAKRHRRGYNLYEAKKIMRDRNYFGSMMVEVGEADAFISGLTRKYPDTIRPALQIIGTIEEHKLAGMYILLTRNGPLFLADTTINFDPSADELVDIAVLAAKAVRQFKITPRIAFLSYSNFGSVEGEESIKMREAVAKLKINHPHITADGEVQANLAFDTELLKENYPFSELVHEQANTLIFPNLSSGNIAYKLIQTLGSTEVIGPVLLGMKKPVHILQLGSSVREIVNMIAIAVVDAQRRSQKELEFEPDE